MKAAGAKKVEAEGFSGCAEFDKAIVVFDSILGDTQLLSYVGTPEGDAMKLKEFLMEVKMNLAVSHFKLMHATQTIEILEALLPQLQDANIPIQGIAMARNMLQTVYGGIEQFDKLFECVTADWEYNKTRFGEVSAESITILTKRGNTYFQLKNYPAAMADHHEVLRLMVLYQGADHEETKKSVEHSISVFKEVGLTFEPFPAAK